MTPRSHPCWAAILLAGMVVAGGGCTEIDFSNGLDILIAPDQDPLAGASSLEVTIHYPEGEPVVGLLTVSPGVQEVVGLRPGSDVRIEVVARDYEGTPVSLGRTGPLEIGEDGVDAAVFLGVADSLARLPNTLLESRAFSTLVPLEDEHFAILGGGNTSETVVSAVELFGRSPRTPLASEAISSLTRIGHQAVYLPADPEDAPDGWAGQIVLIGGTTTSHDDIWSGGVSDAIDSVVLVDTQSGTITAGAAYFESGVLGASTVLTPEGQIAVVAGVDDDDLYRETVQILLPGETFPIAGPTIEGRVMHQLTPMEVAGEPRYFLSGGLGEDGLIGDVEIWDGRQTSDFVRPFGMTLEVPRARHQATAMPGNRILISGGAGNIDDRTEHGLSIPSAEVIDSETGEVWTVGDTLDVPRQRHVAASIPNGRVLLCGGVDTAGQSLGSCEVYDEASDSFHGFLGGSFLPGGAGVSAASLPDGRVLFAGGHDGEEADGTLYIYTPPDWQD